ncbi:MAG: GDP-mannose 4,6-dehydratase, partial [Microvirga sp.]|nr:GDP-mannose 4,6-dehydratase [Microvirga sp.]
MSAKRALITGVTGQDGAYLSKFLIDKGYEVHGLLRRSASADVVDTRLKWIGVAGKIALHDGNLTDLSGL